MNKDKAINDLAHELWAMSQGSQSIEEAIQRIVSKLESFATLAVCIDRERIFLALPGGCSVDPQWVADMVRDGFIVPVRLLPSRW